MNPADALPGGQHSSSAPVEARPRRRWIAGGLLVLLGLLANRWALERVLSPDEYFESSRNVGIIYAFQAVLVLSGLWLILRRPARPPRRAFARAFVAVAAIAVLAAGWANVLALHLVEPRKQLHDAVATMVESENLLLELRIEIKPLTEGALNLVVPDVAGRPLFADEVELTDLADAPAAPAPRATSVPVEGLRWPRAPARRLPPAGGAVGQPGVAQVRAFEHAKINIARGQFTEADKSEWEGDVSFDGVARSTAGMLQQFSGGARVRWRKLGPEEGAKGWRITVWDSKPLSIATTAEPFFAESLDTALPDAAQRARARRSIHEEYVLASYVDPEFQKPHPRFTREAVDCHPGVAVADVDGDGFDDIYVMERWGRNLLLKNRGDGTFEECAAMLGLDVEAHCSSAIFADFDNDGDLDAFIGRTLAPSLYLLNEGGRFKDVSKERVKGRLPSLVSSVSAADYDQDGLLDIYCVTYAHDALIDEFNHKGLLDEKTTLAGDLSEKDARALYERLDAPDAHQIANCPGPPNILLHNAGGGVFEEVADTPLRLFKNTYQATWSDYDGDGDQDVYCANDFSSNNLFRNEGGGRFGDVTEASNAADIGFGMGASWGDFDEDGDVDLYVSNMFSKAGRRMTAQIPGIDPKFQMMARGNSLLRNDGGRFERVSGLEAPAQLVEKVGWSWGGEFLDCDNDGDLDIHALSGHYTAPKEVEGPVDR